MIKKYCLVLIFMGLCLQGDLPAQNFDIQETLLDNGMQILTLEQHDAPVVTCAVFYKVGSICERPGITGVSHLLEHMMFKGTEVIGTKDYPSESSLQEALDRLREDMRREELETLEAGLRGLVDDPLNPANQSEQYRELGKQFDDTLETQRQYMIKEHLDQLYNGQGGFMTNAFTAEDMTGYFVRLPVNKIELFLWLESDRMQNSTFREFYPEQQVVREERRLTLESQPTGRIEESFNAMFWESSPYGWSVVGWPRDIENISRADIREYYRRFYAPDNAVGIFIGDFETEALISKIRDYFERVPFSGRTLPVYITPEIEQVGEKRLVAEARANPGVTMRYHTRAFRHPDTYPLEVLAELLSGKTGRLYRTLVKEKELALGDEIRSRMGSRLRVDAEQNTLKYAGYFEITAEAREEAAPGSLEKNINEILQELAKEPVPPDELERAKNQVLAARIRYMKQFFGFLTLFEIGTTAVYGDWQEINEKPGKIAAVTAADVQRAASTYFKPANRNILILHTLKEEKEEGAPSSRTSAMLERIRKINDRTELHEMIQQMESMRSQVQDEKMARGIDKLLAAAYERLEALEEGEEQ